MLGEMIAVKAVAVVGFRQPQPAGKQLAMRDAGVVHVVEYAEFHGRLPLASFRGAQSANPESIITDWEGIGNGENMSPRVAQRAGAGIGLRTARELAVELGGERPVGGHVQLRGGGGERGVLRRRRAVDGEA